MTLHTQQSLSGFIASDPQQSVTENGETRFYVRVGQPHFRREDSGSFTVLEPSFHDLVAYRATADRALTRFAKGDSFVAGATSATFSLSATVRSSIAKSSSQRRSATTSHAPTTTSTDPAAQLQAPKGTL